jgi:deoxyribodipyrimidine photo-lyase
MVDAAADRLPVRLRVVDSNGLLPLRAADKAFSAAYHFRRFLQRTLPEHLDRAPMADPLSEPLPRLGSVPQSILERWPAAPAALLDGRPESLAALAIDHDVRPVSYRGGTRAAAGILRRFLDQRLAAYADERNDPDADATSGLSPWLHWGHVSVHEVLAELARREEWDISRIAHGASGAKAGWWNMSAAAESFLDELVTWRELGFNTCTFMPDYDAFTSLPDWAQATLADHASDPRPHVYSREQFESAATHDPLWNAAQRQLMGEGRIHNYLRMLWGKKILEWSKTPQDAFALAIELNNRWSVDGRNPNSYAGISWVFGRYDRGWPERAIYGKVRSMSSDSTRRKVTIDDYMRRWGADAQSELGL